MSKILRKTLAILYSRREVEMCVHYLFSSSSRGRDEALMLRTTRANSAEMALWLRLIVSILIHRNDRDQALAYVENAAHFIAQHQVQLRSAFAKPLCD